LPGLFIYVAFKCGVNLAGKRTRKEINKKMTTKRKIFFIEGNIASGKSSVLEQLKERGFAICYEPVEEWKELKIGAETKNLLGLFYQDMPKWSFAMQIAVITSRFNSLLAAYAATDPSVPLIVERSLWTDENVFALNLKQLGHLSDVEWTIMSRTLSLLLSLSAHIMEGSDMKHIYIKTSPDVCHQRQQTRDRVEERVLTETPTYLVELHCKHSDWMESPNFSGCAGVIDGDRDKASVLADVLRIINK
jgi:deoxyadenosine/deoxycytidine kinase